VQPLTNTSGWLYISSGRTAQMFKWGVFSSSFLVISFFFGLPYGARGVALSYSIAKLLQTWPCMYYATRGTPITMLNLLEAMKHPLLASLIAGAIAFGVKLAIAPTLTVWATVIVSLTVMALTYLILMFYVFNTKELYLSVLKQLKRPKGS
jgi:PST family polysaccharide transporter